VRNGLAANCNRICWTGSGESAIGIEYLEIDDRPL
jgi:hypothetical protein